MVSMSYVSSESARSRRDDSEAVKSELVSHGISCLIRPGLGGDRSGPAIPCETETREADDQHRPGRRFRN
jgi:hypothetical protein